MTSNIKGQNQPITLDNIMSVPDHTEIVDGELREKPVAGYIHALVITHLMYIIGNYVRAQQLGACYADGLTYILHVDDNDVPRTRIPDFSFMRRGALPQFDKRRPVPAAPTLAVEVVSASESAAELNDKINDYLTYGAEAVWVIYPEAQKLHVHQPNSKTITVYEADDTLQDEALLPGLSVTIRDLFVDADEI